MAKKNPPPLSDAQLEIMSIVWELGSGTVADVLKQLQDRRSVTRNTVHTMMTRLADKGWLYVEEQEGPFVYTAAVPRHAAQQSCLELVVKTVFDGSTEGLLLSLLQNTTLSREEANRVRKMIRDAEERS